MKNYKTYQKEIKNKNATYTQTIAIATRRVITLVSDETIRKFFNKYCEITGYNKPEDYEQEKENTLNGIIDVEVAFLLAERDNDFSDRNINRHQHDLWSFHRLQEGWKYGENKDKINKLNPCLKPFKELTEEEISWDNMFLQLYKEFVLK